MYVKFRQPYKYTTYPGIASGPFYVDVETGSSGNFQLQLCLVCSKSYDHSDVSDRPNLHLIPRWRFLDKNKNLLESNRLNIYPQPVFNTDGVIVKYQTSVEFYFIDDMASSPRPVYLRAELRQLACSNDFDCTPTLGEYEEYDLTRSDTDTTIYDLIPVWINRYTPQYIKITKDGINDISYKWQSLPFNAIVTLHDKIASECNNEGRDPIIFDFLDKCSPSTPIQLKSFSYENNSYTETTSSTYFCPETPHITPTIISDNLIGGYTSNIVSFQTSGSNVYLDTTMHIAVTSNNIFENQFSYIANPNNGSIFSLYRRPAITDPSFLFQFNTKQLCLFEGDFEEMPGTGGAWEINRISTPIVEHNTNNEMGLTGFAGIYGIAVDRNYCTGEDSIWTTDAELDKVFKISANGDILKTIDFSYLNGITLSPFNSSSNILVDIPSKSINTTLSYDISSSSNIESLKTILSLSANQLYNSFFSYVWFDIKVFDSSILKYTQTFFWLPTENRVINLNFDNLSPDVTFTINTSAVTVNEHILREILLEQIPITTIYGFNHLEFVGGASDISGVTPAAIALDDNRDVWVTLFDTNTIYKFSSEGDLITSISFGNDVDYYPINQSEYGEDVPYKPAIVETDVDNNVWVGYNNTFSSALIKYHGSNFNQLTTISLETSATPVDLLVDGVDNSLWVSLAYSYVDTGEIRHYNENGVLLSTHSNILAPSNITIDKQRRIWYTHSYNKVSCITPIPGEPQYEFTLDDTYDDSWKQSFQRTKIHALEGIACDINNTLWVVDSLDNYSYNLNLNLLGTDTAAFAKFKISPDNNKEWYNDTLDGSQYEIITFGNKSAQAFCDWTGYRWWQKYIGLRSLTIDTVISGQSNTFNVYPFSNPWEFRKYNESWDATTQIRDYNLAPHMHSKYNLWVNFFGGAVGGLEYGMQLGRTVYERIANFSPNHIDIDTSNIPQLFSLSTQIDVPIDSYNLAFPPFMSRIMNIASINHSRLWGERIKCNLNITDKKICPRCNLKHTNKGKEINDIFTYNVSANSPIIIHNRLIVDEKSAWQLINVPPKKIDGFGTLRNAVDVCLENKQVSICEGTTLDSCTDLITSYPLTTLLDENHINYQDNSFIDYYQYLPGFPVLEDCDPLSTGVPVANSVLNWGDDYNTLIRQQSSIDLWYKNEGLLDRLIQYDLLRGLQIPSFVCNLTPATYQYQQNKLTAFIKAEDQYYAQVCTGGSIELKTYVCRKYANDAYINISKFEWFFETTKVQTTIITDDTTEDTYQHSVSLSTPLGEYKFWVKVTDTQNNVYIAPFIMYVIDCTPIITPDKTNVNEGESVTWSITTSNIVDGTILYWVNNGSTNGNDFNDGLNNGSVTIYNNSASFTKTLENDITTEGEENIVIQLRSESITGPVIGTSIPVTVNDTSKPTYSITPNTTSVDEGDTVVWTINTTDVPDGTELYWTNEGTTNGYDFDDSADSGSVIINNNTATLSKTLVEDLTTEGSENIIIYLKTNSVSGIVVAIADTVTVNDTSQLIPTYSITSNPSTINEGQTVTFNITTTHVPNNTILYWTNSGSTNGNDFSDSSNSGTVTINNNAASFTKTLRNDVTTEGTETIIIELRTGSIAGNIVATSNPIIVFDTSINFAEGDIGIVVDESSNSMRVESIDYNTSVLFNISNNDQSSNSMRVESIDYDLVDNIDIDI